MRADRSARWTLLEGFVLGGLDATGSSVVLDRIELPLSTSGPALDALRFLSRVLLLAKVGVRAGAGDGEGKGTPLELFSSGVLDMDPQIKDLITAA